MASNAQTISEHLPLLAGTVNTPMLPAIALIALSVGFVADAPYLLATGHNLLAEMGLSDLEQFSVRGLLVAALCFVFKLLLSYHKDAMRRKDDETKQLRAERDEALRQYHKLLEK